MDTAGHKGKVQEVLRTVCQNDIKHKVEMVGSLDSGLHIFTLRVLNHDEDMENPVETKNLSVQFRGKVGGLVVQGGGPRCAQVGLRAQMQILQQRVLQVPGAVFAVSGLNQARVTRLLE